MGISLKLIDSVSSIKKMANQAIAAKLKKGPSKEKLNKAARHFKELIAEWIREQPEIQSLSGGGQGSLAAQFGLFPGQEDSAINAIIKAVTKAIEVDVKRINVNTLDGSLLTFNFQPSSMSNLLSLPEGQVIQGETVLRWLEWLLVKGTTTIIKGYSYKASNQGRSGGGTMEPKGTWRVDPRFAGTLENNFITRAFDGREKDIQKFLEGIFDGL